jgi:hypothetical protein
MLSILEQNQQHMKRLLLLACALVSLSTISQAQITKGSVLLGGSIGFYRGETKTGVNESKTNNLAFHPAVGIAINNNWAIGLTAGFSNYRWKTVDAQIHDQKDKQFLSGVFVRRYSPIGKNFYLYGNGQVAYTQNEQSGVHSYGYSSNFTSKGIALNLAPGIAYALSKRFHVEASLNNLLSVNYAWTTTANTSQTDRTVAKGKTFNVGTNFSTSGLSLGVRFVLGK